MFAEFFAAWRVPVLIGAAAILIAIGAVPAWRITSWHYQAQLATAATRQQACSDQNVVLNDRLQQQNAAADALAAATAAAARKGAQARAAAAKASQAYQIRIAALTGRLHAPAAAKRTCDDALAEWRAELNK